MGPLLEIVRLHTSRSRTYCKRSEHLAIDQLNHLPPYNENSQRGNRLTKYRTVAFHLASIGLSVLVGDVDGHAKVHRSIICCLRL